MHQSGKAIGFWSAVALGMGAMIGAGIFALLGQAGVIAGTATYLSFIAGGVVALFSGYSLSRLGARYPAAGGIVEYLAQCYGEGLFSGAMSIVLYIAGIISLALVARTFGSYAASLLPAEITTTLAVPILSSTIVIFLMWVNLEGARNMARLENIIVASKVGVLVVLAIAGLRFLQPALLAPADYPPADMILFSLGITFFAYEGFRVITNTAEDMDDPAKTLPRAMLTSIVLVMLLYIGVTVAVFGNLPADQVVEAKDYALAAAARPVFGQAGFVAVSLAALVSTASAINASLYSVTNVTYQMARNGELPGAFAQPIGHSKEGLVISSLLIVVLAVVFDLSKIAAIGSIAVLLVHGIVHLGHLFQTTETGASRVLVVLAVVATFGALTVASVYLVGNSPQVLLLVVAFVAVAFAMEFFLRRVHRRIVGIRTPQ